MPARVRRTALTRRPCTLAEVPLCKEVSKTLRAGIPRLLSQTVGSSTSGNIRASPLHRLHLELWDARRGSARSLCGTRSDGDVRQIDGGNDHHLVADEARVTSSRPITPRLLRPRTLASSRALTRFALMPRSLPRTGTPTSRDRRWLGSSEATPRDTVSHPHRSCGRSTRKRSRQACIFRCRDFCGSR
jgi:hypothetical protein